jgi:6-phosphogluconolactonase (cycloisomerase 2 family)
MSHHSFAFSLLVAASIASLAFDFVEREFDGAGGVELLGGALGVTASQDGRHVYVAGSLEDAVTVFARSFPTGALDFASATAPGTDALDVPTDVVLSPDGAHLYVTGSNSDTIAVFARDAVSGALAFVEREKDGEGGITDLNAARVSVVSPDGAHVYVAAAFDSAVVAFARNSETGALSHLGSLRDGVAGVDGLLAAVAIAVSPDGAHVYVAGNSDDKIAVFERDATSGALAFVESIANGAGEPPADGLDGASEIAMTPDGALLYVTGTSENGSTIAVFQRDAATGALAFVQVERSGENGFDGFANPFGVAVAAGERNVYVTGLEDGGVAVLAPEPGAAAIAAIAALAALARARARR